MSVLTNVELCFWNLDKGEPPSIDMVRARLTENHLNPERAVSTAEATAFRRAASAVSSKEVVTRCFTRKADSVLVVQIDSEVQDEGRLHRRFVAQYALTPIDDSPSMPELIAGNHVDGFIEAFDHATTHYVWGDVSKIIQEILKNDGLGAYSPKKNGGVYYVPVSPASPELLNRIGRFTDALHVHFLRHQVPDLTAHREEIAEAIAQAYLDEIASHAESIAGYSEDTRPGVLENRRTAIQATDASMQRVRNLMNGRFAIARESMRELLAKLAEIEARIEAKTTQGQQEARIGGRRNIVMTEQPA